VRENGGQYTHGAIWSAMAFAAMGDRERAWKLTTMINPVNHALDQAAAAHAHMESGNHVGKIVLDVKA